MKSDQARPAPRAHRLRCLTTPTSPPHNSYSLRSNFQPQIANPNSNWSFRLCPANPWNIGYDERCYRVDGPRLASHSPGVAQTRSIPIRTATTRQSILGQIRPAFVSLVSFCKMSCPRLSPTFSLRLSHATPSNIGFSTRCYRVSLHATGQSLPGTRPLQPFAFILQPFLPNSGIRTPKVGISAPKPGISAPNVGLSAPKLGLDQRLILTRKRLSYSQNNAISITSINPAPPDSQPFQAPLWPADRK